VRGTRCRSVFRQPAPDLVRMCVCVCVCVFVCVTPHDVWNIIPILGHTRPYKYLQLNHIHPPPTPITDYRSGAGRREIYATAPLDPFNQTLSRRRVLLVISSSAHRTNPFITPPPHIAPLPQTRTRLRQHYICHVCVNKRVSCTYAMYKYTEWITEVYIYINNIGIKTDKHHPRYFRRVFIFFLVGERVPLRINIDNTMSVSLSVYTRMPSRSERKSSERAGARHCLLILRFLVYHACSNSCIVWMYRCNIGSWR